MAAITVNGVTLPLGPLFFKHAASGKYLTRTKRTFGDTDMIGIPRESFDMVAANDELACGLGNLIEFVRYNDKFVMIKQAVSGLYWKLLDARSNLVGDVEGFRFLMLTPNGGHLFTPIQSMDNGQIHFKVDDHFLSPVDGTYLGSQEDFMHYDSAFELELGLLKRVMRNLEYDFSKALTTESIAKAPGKVSLDNPSNSVEQTVSRKHTETVTESKKWATSTSIATRVTIKASIPLYAGSGSASVEVSQEEEQEVSTGNALVTTLEIADELSAKVPPGYKVDATMIVITGSISVPFSYNVTDYYMDGYISDHDDKRFDDGMFKGVSLHTTKWNVNETITGAVH